jgi:hypothetical protein
MRSVAWVGLGSSFLFSIDALAQAPAQAPAFAPSFAPTPAPRPAAPVPPAPNAERPASGVFVGLGLGIGYFHASSGSAADTRVFSGGTGSGQLVLGGRIGKHRNVTLGAAYLRDQVFALTSKDEVVDGDEPDLRDVSMALSAFGFFADVALESHPALHFQGVVALGSLVTLRSSGNIDDPSGFVFDLGVGYEFFRGGGLALGALLRANYAPFYVDEQQGTSVQVLTPSLLLTLATR